MPKERSPAIITNTLKGIRMAMPLILGMIALGLAFGVVVSAAGYAWWWAPIFSTVIYAGSMEFIALTLLTQGAGLITVALTALVVNFRHIFYGLSHPKVEGFGRGYAVYSLTDEAYALLAGKQHLPKATMLGAHAALQAGWVLPGALGAYLGHQLPWTITGIDFIMPALFCALAVEAYRSMGTPPMVVWELISLAISWVLVPSAAVMVAILIYVVVASVPRLVPTRPHEVVVIEQEAL